MLTLLLVKKITASGRRLPESKDLAAAVFAAVICPGPRRIVNQTNHSARSALSEILQLRFRMTGESLTALTLAGHEASHWRVRLTASLREPTVVSERTFRKHPDL